MSEKCLFCGTEIPDGETACQECEKEEMPLWKSFVTEGDTEIKDEDWDFGDEDDDMEDEDWGFDDADDNIDDGKALLLDDIISMEGTIFQKKELNTDNRR